MMDLHVLEVAGLVVDADLGRRQIQEANLPRSQQGAIRLSMKSPSSLDGQPWSFCFGPLAVAQHLAVGRGLDVLELADVAMEGDVRQLRSGT